MSQSIVALVPARRGSVRVPGKNTRVLAGHPLVAYTIAAARESGIFDAVLVSTDDEETAAIAERYGASVPGLRPASMATATSPDIEWVRHVIDGRTFDAFSILRPTSPFRRGATIARAWAELRSVPDADSVRAVRRVREHPGKMWRREGSFIVPLLPQSNDEVPTHSRQTAALEEVFVQDSSLEVAWSRLVADGEIAGGRVLPFDCGPVEGFTIDYPDDWDEAERLASTSPELLPDPRR